MIGRLIGTRLSRSKKHVLLLGARQVGKSTLARTLGPELVLNLMDQATFLAYSKAPGRFSREIRALTRPSLVLVDEIQRLPTLLNNLQALMDEGTRHRFILTGSSARKLRRGGANLLPGRVVLEYLDPLTIWELGGRFDLERTLQIGALPGIYLDDEGGSDVLDTYATVYLKEEIQAEAIVRDVGTYARFLDIAAAASGEWINYSKLASDAEIPKETIRRFFQILEDTLVAFRIPPFSPRAAGSRRHVSQRDRFVLFDVGVRNALLGLHKAPPTPTERGRLFEQWLILQCLAFIRAHRLPWRWSSYRTDDGVEVDLVLDTPTATIAIECKAGRAVTRAQLAGLRSIARIVSKPLHRFVVFQGERAEAWEDGITAVPYHEFLLRILPRFVAAEPRSLSP